VEVEKDSKWDFGQVLERKIFDFCPPGAFD
jgi:hypothetical protein